MTAREDIARAMQAGKAAAEQGQPITACPHRHDSPDNRDRVLARLWCRAYQRVTPLPIDYGEGSL